jgi:hypothetical protein
MPQKGESSVLEISRPPGLAIARSKVRLPSVIGLKSLPKDEIYWTEEGAISSIFDSSAGIALESMHWIDIDVCRQKKIRNSTMQYRQEPREVS